MKKALIITLSMLLVAVVGAAFYTLNQRTANDTPRRINLDEGTSYQALCDTLDASPTFRLMAHALGLDKHVREGSYIIEAHMNELALIRKLRNGQQDPIRLTIGKFRLPQQLNEYLNNKLMHNDFNVTLDSFYLIRPNTYEFYWTVTPERFMARMTDEFNAFWKDKTGNFDYNLKNIIIIASIVEEETNDNAEKPLIASVYLNRLSRGMPLQADPTVKYAVGDFTLRRILNKHLGAESPFNTYLHAGLPPAPICLPSEASVNAVIGAPQTNYIYFCASENMDGTHRFAATLAEHNANAARYHRALERMGVRR
jgi:UPF0755 protein